MSIQKSVLSLLVGKNQLKNVEVLFRQSVKVHCRKLRILCFSRQGNEKNSFGIPVLHTSISGRQWDLISGGKRVGELRGLKWKFEAWTEVQQLFVSIL